MKIVRWSTSDIPNLQKYGVIEVYTEIDMRGAVVREVGLSQSGDVSYVSPATGGENPFGLFDGMVIDLSSLGSDESLSPEEFDVLWNRGRVKSESAE
jgi:hypothetical protein